MNSKEKKIDAKLTKNVKKCMGEDDIRYYFNNKNMPIIRYRDLANIQNIEELLPNKKSVCFILYQNSDNEGHWCLLERNNNNISFFDSYGKPMDTQLNYITPQENYNLGITDKYLTNLISKSNYNFKNNKVKYQQGKIDINSCGRHCVFKALNLMECDRNLDEYEKIMKDAKKIFKTSYDKIVSLFIDK